MNNEVVKCNPEPNSQEIARFFGDQRFDIGPCGEDSFINAYTAANPWEVRPAVELAQTGYWRPVTVYVGHMPAQISWLHNINDDMMVAASGSYLKPEFRGKRLYGIRQVICETVREVYASWGYTWIAGVRKDNPSGMRWTEEEWRCFKGAQLNGHCVTHDDKTVDLWVYVAERCDIDKAVVYAELVGWPAEKL